MLGMLDPVLIITFVIQAVAVIMVLYTFIRISESNFPQLEALERYHLMRERYEHLRWSLLFVGLLIMVQLAGVVYYFVQGSIPILQVLVSDGLVVALTLILSRIYKARGKLQDMDITIVKKEKKAK